MTIENMIATIDGYAQTQPDRVVYDVLGEQHTYAQLKQHSDAIAQMIDEMNLAPKQPVMVFGGQEYAMIATFIGLTKAGHAYIPVDINSANERLTNILTIGEPAAVIAVDDLPIAIDDVPVVTPDMLAQAMQVPVDYSVDHAVLEDDTYYIIFTSGTTGKPKGVQISHRNLLSFVNWIITDDAFALPEQPKMLAQPPYSFDLSVMYWAPTLATGGTMYAMPKATTENFKDLFAVLPQLPIQVWTSTPSFVDMAMLSDAFNSENMPMLSHFYFCGEELTVSTAAKLHERFPNARIVNSFGPTEATVAFSAVAITPAMLAKAERLPIGYVKPDSPTYIMNESGERLAADQQGEIIVTGPAVSKGYINNPEKTAQAFFELDGERAYHTGDVGTLDQTGLLHYGGRMDFQIKFNGYRIELEEVAHILNLSQYLDAAVAVPRYNDQHKVQQLLAYVVAKPGVRAQFEKDLKLTMAIKAELVDDMMAYMMPSRFIYRDELPITPNGKVDIKKLIAEVNA
ncbi:D-alanine--poly(phosphoribitol) ligase subunit DltA [Weissella diestrammenae]|uniref:D-alanine--D-alanyl carrier protein ligase n=1 Tax=Weissella diestrammenae TaxID=1162633 RepID=A0A7G9T6L8_9LACO|nr:D-alanine--poly(phosphoribitol) ligase subunit DltA [Weissella diestrammenae]MCM0582978.1 D-alanine--poly(phosphoribitol) ligase subunit DltA [Weissella diestrammenae]QNN75743.1 D-alanine--poly(phosphoribitol) ligase subunit DltA [Weissella diestrammenae]